MSLSYRDREFHIFSQKRSSITSPPPFSSSLYLLSPPPLSLCHLHLESLSPYFIHRQIVSVYHSATLYLSASITFSFCDSLPVCLSHAHSHTHSLPRSKSLCICSGDHPLTAEAIARKIGLITTRTRKDVAKARGCTLEEVHRLLFQLPLFSLLSNDC